MAERSESFSNGGRNSKVAEAGGHTPHGTDPSVLTTQQLIRELTGLRELLETRLDGMDKAIELGQKAIDQFPTFVDMKVTQLGAICTERFESVTRQFAERDTRADSAKNDTRATFDARINAIDVLLGQMKMDVSNLPKTIEAHILQLQSLQQEKFDSIQTQFIERDTRQDTTKKDAKDALDTALQAAKEAVEKQNTASALGIAKAETATAKQIDQQALLIQSTASSLDGKITDVKDRLTRIEGVALGSVTAQTQQQAIKDSGQSTNSNIIAIIAAVCGAIGVIAAIAIALISR